MAEKIEIDDEVWTIKEMRDGLPIFINEDDEECYPIFNYNYPFCDEENAKYWALLIETENNEWMDTFEKVRDKEETDRRLKANADEWYVALETVSSDEAEEGKEQPIGDFDEFKKEYMLNHKEEVKERLERFFDYEVVDWWFDDEPFDSLTDDGYNFYDVWDIWVKFGKKLED
jgi:hypothetical protein